MNATLFNFFLSIAGILIMLLVTVVAYFLKQWLENASKQWLDSTTALTNAVNKLETAVAVITSNQGTSEKACTATHQLINTRLNAHSEKINEHGEAIIELQVITQTARKKLKQNQTDKE